MRPIKAQQTISSTMLLINQLEEYETANVELVGSRLVAAEIESDVILRPMEDGQVALQTLKADGRMARCVLPQELLDKSEQIHELHEALDDYVTRLRPSLFEDSITKL